MEEKKFNNAIEKAENLSEDTKKVKNDSEGDFQNDNNMKGLTRAEQIVKLQEQEEERARQRIATAELKRESKEQERKAKAEQHALNLEQKKRMAMQKEEQRREKIKAKQEHQKQMMEERKEKTSGRDRGVGGWIAAVAILSCACLILGTILISDIFMKGSGESMLSNLYARSFYDLVDYVDNIDVNLSKLTTARGNENRQKILVDLTVQANLAEADLAELPLKEESKTSTIKFINQVGDFSKYLNNKLIDEEPITEEDMQTLLQMKKINAELCKKLKTVRGEIENDFDFITLLNGEENAIMNSFSELENHAVEYPKMIYDGPFADEPENKSSDAKNGEKGKMEISEEQAVKIFEKAFADYNPSEITVSGMATGKHFSVYNIEGMLGENGVYAQISSNGKIVMFDSFSVAKSKKFTRDECIENATKFLNKCGYSAIKAVWANESKENMTYINFAGLSENKEVVLYSDLIKVAVCMETGRVCDMDAHAYVKNHKPREIDHPKIKVEDAERNISEDINVQTSRLALIPVTPGKERLAYEFYGENSDGKYYVYVDAITGKELKIFKVVSTNDGDLLL